MLNVFIWGLVFLPLSILAYGFYQIQIAGNILYWTAEPGKYLVHFIGQWAISFLILTTAITPIRKRLGYNLIPYRRRLGLAAFFYAVLHVLAYAAMMLGFELSVLTEDFAKRPYITAGMVAVIGLLPMAVTSTKGWQRRLKRKWKTLHQLIYPAIIAVIIHLWWQVRQDFSLALFVTLLVSVLWYFRFSTKKS